MFGRFAHARFSIGVSIAPGQMTLQRIPSAAYWPEIVLPIAFSAPLVAPYAIELGVRRAANEETKTIAPPPAALSQGIAARALK